MSAEANKEHEIDANYSSITTKGPDNKTVVEIFIETAIPLTLTQQAQASNSDRAHIIRVPETSDVMVFGDVVTIEGEVHTPGRQIVIFARQVVAVPANNQGPALIVDGKPGDAPHPSLAKPSTPTKDGESGYAYTRPISGNQKDSTGGTGRPGTPGDAGEPGSDGSPSGSIAIFTKELITEYGPLRLSAKGGNGGKGQDGQAGGDGGRGGHGQDAVCYWPQSIVYKPSTAGGQGGKGGRGGDGGPGGSGTPGGQIICKVIEPRKGNQITPSIQGGEAGDPGAPGKRGEGGPGGTGGREATWNEPNLHGAYKEGKHPASNDGPPGDPGDPGDQPRKKDAAAAGYADFKFEAQYGELSKVANLTQLQRMLALTRVLYLSADLKKDVTRRAEVASRLKWLKHILEALALEGDPNRPDYQPNEPRKALRDAMLTSVKALCHNMVTLKDYFGNGPDFVPLGALDAFETALDASLQTLKDIEPIHESYLADLKHVTQEANHLQTALSQATRLLSDIEQELKTLRDTIRKQAAEIESLDQSAEVKRGALEEAIRDFEKAVHDTLNFPKSQSLIEALGTLAFYPHKGESGEDPIFQKLSMTSSVVGQLGTSTLDDIANTVVTDGGEQLSKKYVVQKLDVFGRDVTSLHEAYKISKTIALEDPDAYKLLIKQEDFDKICNDFYHSLEAAKDAKRVMEDYVNMVKSRNEAILLYNDFIARWYDLIGKRALIEAQKAQCEGGLAEVSAPYLAGMTAFIDGLYNHVRDQCIYLLYMASRALTLWSLKDYDAFYEILNLSNPLAINAAVIETGRSEIITKRYTEMVLPKQDFGAGPDDPGIVVTFDEANASRLIAALKVPQKDASGKDVYVLEFPLQPAVLASTKEETPFAGMANVRLTKIRCWIEGMHTDDNVHEINITHSGDEVFVDEVSNRKVHFEHAPFPRLFRYDAGRGIGKRRAIVMDGDLLARDLPLKSYTPIGPFTRKWRVSVHAKNNSGLKMDGVRRVIVEFHGRAFGFSADS